MTEEHNNCGTPECCGVCDDRVYRDWGYYRVLAEGDGYTVKELVFKPSGVMSNQRHFHRAEHWQLIKGEIVFGVHIKEAPDSWDAPLGRWHEARNISGEEAVVIETWTGDKLDESDIERKESGYTQATKESN